MPLYCGIDNGVSGSIGIIKTTSAELTTCFIRMADFTISEQDYCKQKRSITRIDPQKLYSLLSPYKSENPTVMIERPMVNPGRFRATVSAVRCLECTLIVLQSMLHWPIIYLDSKKWQKELLPHGCVGSKALKDASRDIGLRLHPLHREVIHKQGDADGILIAEYCWRFYGGAGTETPKGRRRRS